MADDLPEYYFRIRENGAAVFRLEPENRLRRLEMEQIAVANARNGEIKPHGNRDLTSADMAAIRAWLTERQALLAGRELDEIRRTIEQLNLAAQWAQSKASDEALEELTEPLLMAMHDLRSVLVRKKADRLMAKGGGEA
ncbi:hypothetical protein [Acidimangrovimonas pyrenivorans]|uniref:Uncharacterized protein n=1 Tax=Acidimangrovimonas pyrenivorans TaxID=2030798 RepID=A0ABV7ACU9_9RHOB